MREGLAWREREVDRIIMVLYETTKQKRQSPGGEAANYLDNPCLSCIKVNQHSWRERRIIK